MSAATQKPRGRVPRAVAMLGVVSLFTDASSEMIAPLLPAFLLALGGSAMNLGLIEGLADAAAGAFRLVSGTLADRAKRKKPLIALGYTLSSCARPLVAAATGPLHVLVVRFADRMGKGMRGSPRDALVAEITPREARGRAFGLQRALDHTGNVIGPLIAFLFLQSLGREPALADYRLLFALAAIPAAAALLTLAFGVKEPAREAQLAAAPRPPFSIRPPAIPALRRFLAAHLLFGLGASTDAFLLLRAAQLGVPHAQLPLFALALSLVQALLTTQLGALSDRVSRKGMILAGWAIYAAVYAGFAYASAPWHAWALIAVYGVHYALVEGAERAFVAEIVPARVRGRAFGSYHFVTAIVALPASLLFGWLHDALGAPAAFLAGAGWAGAGWLVLALWVRPPAAEPPAA